MSDPLPSHCAACFDGAREGLRFVDLDAAIDRGVLASEQGWVLAGIDDLHLCENCVRGAAEVLALKPQLVSEMRLQIRKLEADAERWRDYARELERSLERRPIAVKKRS